MRLELDIDMPEIVRQAYVELQTVPFYKDGNFYLFAKHTLETEKSAVRQLLEFAHVNEPTKEVFRNAIDMLSELHIVEDELTAWISFRKELGKVAEYHNTLDVIFQNLLLVLFEESVINQMSNESIEPYYQRKTIDLIELPEDSKRVKTDDKFVLNHNNPFADVSIEDQEFLYPSDYEQFEALSLHTSRTLTCVQKDEERSYMVLQPGFKIRKTRGVETHEKQAIIFDDTLTTEITQHDDNLYIYID